jgi:hypothetical protein
MRSTRRAALAGMLAGAGLLAIPRAVLAARRVAEAEFRPEAGRNSEQDVLTAGWEAGLHSFIPTYPADEAAVAEALDHGILLGYALARTEGGPRREWPYRAVAWAGLVPTHLLGIETFEADRQLAARGVDTFTLARHDRAALEAEAPALRRIARQS